MIIKLSKNGEYLVAGKVSRSVTVKQVGSRQATLCEFGVYAGKDENGKKIYVNCKAWDDLGGVLSELQENDPFCGVGKLETREYNGKTYSDLVLDWGNSPMISAGVEAPAPAVSMEQAIAAGTKNEDGFTDLDEYSEDEDGLPF